MRFLIVLALCILTAGCVNLTTKTQPDDPQVNAVRSSSDCAPNILGIMVGNATYDAAAANPSGVIGSHPGDKSPRLTKVRSVQVNDYYFLLAGARCVELLGE